VTKLPRQCDLQPVAHQRLAVSGHAAIGRPHPQPQQPFARRRGPTPALPPSQPDSGRCDQ
jgi:hypothetical protein